MSASSHYAQASQFLLPPPDASHPELIAALNAVAELVSTLPEEAPVSLGSGVSPAVHLFEGLDWLVHTKWTAWLSELEMYGRWPIENDSDRKELKLAISCFAGTRARDHYKMLEPNPRAYVIAVDRSKNYSTETTRTTAFSGMLSLLNKADREFFAMVESLDIPWYSHWATRAQPSTARDIATIPSDFQ